MSKKKTISQRLRAVHAEVLRIGADASLDPRYETVMANLSAAAPSPGISRA